MMHFSKTVACLAAGLLLVATAMAQDDIQWRGSGGWGAGLPYHQLFDSARVQTLTGSVASISRHAPRQGMSDGLHLLLRTRHETLPVQLGPLWFLERQDFALLPGDQLVVRGSRISFDGQPVLIATEVEKGDNLLVLRGQSGYPLWSGWRRR